ncbi:MAG TPA: ABC transporter ATP-binding protein [Candidatus Limnocylindrales bacterium]|nr:ABC transporter ATP-binding protein [Candidatus Limnocylindrales bacterium]
MADRSAPAGRPDGRGIVIDGVVKLFTRRRSAGGGRVLRALEDVSFTIRPHEFVAVIGPSGCGKTTLLRIVAGLVRADAGAVMVDGRPIAGPGGERAMVFQQPSLLPWADVMTNVAFGLKIQGASRSDRLARAEALVGLVGLAGFERSLPRELSGGMQQRVGLARALAVDPRYLLMDEPFGSLDEITRRGMQAELMRIWARQEKAAMFVTHSVDEAVILSDRVVVLSPRPGRVVRDITVDLPRPRDHAVERSPRFLALRDEVWGAISDWQDRAAAAAPADTAGPA